MKLLILRNLLVFFSILLLASFTEAQNDIEHNCGTITSIKSINFYNSIKQDVKVLEQDFMKKKSGKNSASKNSLNTIPIKAHIIRNSDGLGGLDVENLDKAIANLNEVYANAFMEFYLFEGPNYIDDTQLDYYKKGNEKNLIEANYVSGIINIYFIDYIENEQEESICGYTDNVGKNNVIVMKNSCTTNDSSLAHEMGHFFSLVHTHGTSNSTLTTELVDGSNCDTDGDGICDTPADPKLLTSSINNFCGYIGEQTDANGDHYKPDTGNIMSYSRKACRNHFTEQQYARINAYYNVIKDKISTPLSNTDITANGNATNELVDAKIYPNPVSDGTIFIKASLIDNSLGYQILNLQGQTLSKGITANKEIKVNNLASGTYLLVLENTNSSVIKRFIR